MSLKVYDLAGQEVRTLRGRSTMLPGHYEAVWDGRDNSGDDVASGIYLYLLDVGGIAEARKMVLVR